MLITSVIIEPRAINRNPMGIKPKGSIRVPSGAILDPIITKEIKHIIPIISGIIEK